MTACKTRLARGAVSFAAAFLAAAVPAAAQNLPQVETPVVAPVGADEDITPASEKNALTPPGTPAQTAPPSGTRSALAPPPEFLPPAPAQPVVPEAPAATSEAPQPDAATVEGAATEKPAWPPGFDPGKLPPGFDPSKLPPDVLKRIMQGAAPKVGSEIQDKVVPPADAQTNKDAAITTMALEAADPDSVGVLLPQNGGLGLDIWQGTPRALVERLMPSLVLPPASPALFDLARRLMLSLSRAPSGPGLPPPVPAADDPALPGAVDVTPREALKQKSLTTLRVEALLAMGDGAGALQLSNFALDRNLANSAVRQVAEVSILGAGESETCAKVPTYMQQEPDDDWQRLLIFCQLKEEKLEEVQLGIATMREQGVKDDLFFGLVDRVNNPAKVLPRQLTPLRPVNLALMQMGGVPLTPELFARQDAALVPALLAGRVTDAEAKLGLAERAGMRGQIDAGMLRSVYEAVAVQAPEIALAPELITPNSRSRTVLIQAALAELNPQKKAQLLAKFVFLTPRPMFTGTHGTLLADIIKDLPPQPAVVDDAPSIAGALMLAGRGDLAAAWINAARSAVAANPAMNNKLLELWPLMAVNGMIDDAGFTAQQAGWLKVMLKDTDTVGRVRTGRIMALLAALGLPVSDESWAVITEQGENKKRYTVPPAVLDARYKLSARAQRRGETALLTLLMAGEDTVADLPPARVVEMARALHEAGLANEAKAIAREALAAW
ncbi:MAG: hypothetical protein GC131_06610 [Alphaproteobacteria bacterium]|nr:hypothetical protein [Alphaproteobacteria bacterium]